MATGHAKFTRQVGVCLATQGPGAIPSTVGWSPSDRPRADNSSDDNRVLKGRGADNSFDNS